MFQSFATQSGADEPTQRQNKETNNDIKRNIDGSSR